MASLILPRLSAILIVAAGYFLLGQLALLSAVAPGYAASVWPSAGLALGGLLHFGWRAWPGVALGSFALTLVTVLPGSGSFEPAMAISLSNAAGATAQALLASSLVRRFDGPHANWASLGRICAMLALGGPLACVVGASVGVATLWGMGAIATGDAAFNWFTWWVGDTIGVLIVLPLYLVWTRGAAFIRRRHRLMVTLPMLVLMGVITLLFARTNALDQEQLASDFNRRSELIAHNLEQELAEYTEAMQSVAGFLSVSSTELDRVAFGRLVEDLLRRHPNLHAISWSPYVPHRQRAAYEAAMRSGGPAPGGIRMLDAGGQLVPARTQEAYVPVTFMESRHASPDVLGFDLTSEPRRYAALQRARDSGHAATSEAFHLAAGDSRRSGVLIVAAAYRPGAARASAEERRLALRGYVSAVLSVETMMNDFLRGIDTSGLFIRLSDGGAARGGTTLAELAHRGYGSAPELLQQAVARATPVHRSTLLVGDRPWHLLVTLDDRHPLPFRSSMAWNARIAGLLLVALFSIFLLVALGRNVAIEREVRQRTRQLRDSNAALEESNAGLERSQQALRESEEQARSVLDSARDAYIAIDPGGRIVAWNREAEATFGWPRQEALGREVLDLLLPARGSRPRSRLVTRLASGRDRILNRRFEITVQHRSGRKLPVEIIIWATAHGGERRFHAFVHEISSRRQALQRLAAQEAAAATLVESDTLAEAAPKLLPAICHALGLSAGAIWMIDAGHGSMRCCEFWSDHPGAGAFETASRSFEAGCGEGLPGRVWRNGQPAWISDIALDDGFPRRRVALDAGLHAAFAFPVTAGGDLLGVMEFFSRETAVPEPGLLKMMETVGSLLGQFIERRKAEAALFEEKERAEVTLGSIGDGVIVTDTAGRVTYLNAVAEKLTGWSSGEAHGRPIDEVFRLVAQSSGAPLPCPLDRAMQANRRIGISLDAELVRRDGRRLVVEDAAAPVHDRAGQVVGGVMVFQDVSEARAMQMRMSHLTRHDHLTSLPNRALLLELLAHALHHARIHDGELALLLIDLDGFKHINDSLGHDTGDLLLQEVTQRLLASVRSIDTVSRQGGDEFHVLMPEIRSSSDAIRLSELILERIRAPFHVGEAELNLSASVGIALYPADGDNAGELVKHADAAMYGAKQGGRDQFRFFTREISERADRRLEIETALHQALRNHELVLHYQPKVAPATGAITGMEALLRWQRPDGRLAMPCEFIEIAEDSGLMGRIDRWVLEEACRQNAAWQAAGLLAVPVAVNLSAANAQTEQFPMQLADVLAATGLTAGFLQIEMTESQMLDDTERFEALIRSIGAMGVKVAIDDFGTGYSSLGYLQRFPFDILKIDQSFVRTLTENSAQSAIVEAITRIARAFDFALVAEGVETAEQAAMLQAYGCHEMQGYLYSRPVPAQQMEAMLRPDHPALGSWQR